MTNKPILKIEKLNINKVLTSDYGNIYLYDAPKNKPISNPIQTQNTCRGIASCVAGNPILS
jgi:hypothetical protein